MRYLVKRDFWISVMVVFSLCSERLLENYFLEPSKSFLPKTALNSIEIKDLSQILFITPPLLVIYTVCFMTNIY
jgi:hypothetical protein